MAELAERHAQSMGSGAPGCRSEIANTKSERDPFPLRIPGQEQVLFHRAHTNLKCKSAQPAVRLLAIVENMPPRQEGQSCTALPAAWSGTHVIRTLQATHGNSLDIFMQPVFQPILVPRHQGALNFEQERDKIQGILRQNTDQMSKNKEVFAENVHQKRMGELPPDTSTQKASEPEQEVQPPTDDMVMDTPINMSCERRGQKMAVVSIIHDFDEDANEPVVTVYGTFDTEDEAKHYMSETLSKHVIDQDLYVYPMYEWMYISPENTNSPNLPCTYRDKTLDTIMRRHRTKHADVDQYMAQCRENNVDPSIVDMKLPEGGEDDKDADDGGGGGDGDGDGDGGGADA